MSEIRCTVEMPDWYEDYRIDDRWFTWDPEVGIESLKGSERMVRGMNSLWNYIKPRRTGRIFISYEYPLIVEHYGGDPWHNVNDMRILLAHHAWSSPELGGFPEGEPAPEERVPLADDKELVPPAHNARTIEA